VSHSRHDSRRRANDVEGHGIRVKFADPERNETDDDADDVTGHRGALGSRKKTDDA
jgi:hypothetical protein